MRQLADHLLNGKLGHEKFDFKHFNDGFDKIKNLNNSNYCGTSGCAAGECPILWPDKWMFTHPTAVRLVESIAKQGFPPPLDHSPVFDDLGTFFGLTEMMVNHLFVPSEIFEDDLDTREEDSTFFQYPEYYGGVFLEGNATKEQVANNILIFCDKVERGDVK